MTTGGRWDEVYFLNYQIRGKIERQMSFKDPMAAFEKMYKFCQDGSKAPFLSSDEHIGFFSSSDIEWYMLLDDEGKLLAKRRYKNWREDYHVAL